MKPTCKIYILYNAEKNRKTTIIEKNHLQQLNVGSPTKPMNWLCEGGNIKQNRGITDF